MRSDSGKDLLANCRRARPITQTIQNLVEAHIGSPHDTTSDPDFPAIEKTYIDSEEAYSERVRDFLDPSCYPVISHAPGSRSFRLQLCEYDDMTDTLTGQVQALSLAGDPLPFILYDIINDTTTWEVQILNGVSGYVMVFADVEEVGSILFHFPDGRTLKYYEKGDFTRYPYPYKPRYSPEKNRQRREEELNEKLRPKEKVIS